MTTNPHSLFAHPEIPEFEYIKPSTLVEASRFLFEHPGESRPYLGGTDTFVRMRDGIWHDRYLVDVKNVKELAGSEAAPNLQFDPSKGLILGATLNMNQVMVNPIVQQNYLVLVEACRSVASYQLRSRATIVGNLCNASPGGDTIGACLVLNARLKVHGIDGFRETPLSSFFVGPGKTVLRPGDVVTAIHFPPPPAGCTGTYLKLGRNTWSDLSIVGVTAFGFPDPHAVSGFHFRVALASVAPTPLLVPAVEELLSSQVVTPETINEAARMAEKACSPIDDIRGSAVYRREMVRNLTVKALLKIFQRLQDGGR